MRVLVIDAGNSRIKWGYAEDGRWARLAWVATADAPTLGAALRDIAGVDRVAISNVAGPAVARDIAAGLLRLHPAPLWIKSVEEECGVRSGYDDPAQLGSDRWAALIGAWHLFGGPCVVVNVGTTMTVDALTGDGVFVGGMIVPGVDLMCRALAENTAQLKVQGGSFAYFPARTGDAVMSGAINALAGAVERMVRFLAETGEADPLVALSGGGAEALAPRLGGRVEVVENLVLEGLIRIVQEAG